MDEALELADYLPISFKTPSEQEYISFLWEAFEESYDRGKYQFAFLAYHMLMMSFVYFNIWQIKQARPVDFKNSLIGFARDENDLLRATSPFSFSSVNESTILRFFRLIGCENSQIGQYAALVKNRNEAAHANGNIFFATQRQVDAQIRQVLRAVEEIQNHSYPIIQSCYGNFLLDSYDPEEREYYIAEDQIREVLIHANYLSGNDIEICINFDLSSLQHNSRDTIEALHNTLHEVYGAE